MILFNFLCRREFFLWWWWGICGSGRHVVVVEVNHGAPPLCFGGCCNIYIKWSEVSFLVTLWVSACFKVQRRVRYFLYNIYIQNQRYRSSWTKTLACFTITGTHYRYEYALRTRFAVPTQPSSGEETEDRQTDRQTESRLARRTIQTNSVAVVTCNTCECLLR